MVSEDHLWVLLNILITSAFVSAWSAEFLLWNLVWTAHVSVWVDAFPWGWGGWITDFLTVIFWNSWILADNSSWQAGVIVISEWEASTSCSVKALPWFV